MDLNNQRKKGSTTSCHCPLKKKRFQIFQGQILSFIFFIFPYKTLTFLEGHLLTSTVVTYYYFFINNRSSLFSPLLFFRFVGRKKIPGNGQGCPYTWMFVQEAFAALFRFLFYPKFLFYPNFLTVLYVKGFFLCREILQLYCNYS